MTASPRMKRRVFKAFSGVCQMCGKRHDITHDDVSRMRMRVRGEISICGTYRIIDKQDSAALQAAMMALPCVDRIVPGALGGKYIAANVTLLCRSCNSSKCGRISAKHLRTLAEAEAAA